MKKAFITIDDIDQHGGGCECGLCDDSGRSCGAAIYLIDALKAFEDLDPSDCEVFQRLYAPTEQAAMEKAERWADLKGYEIAGDHERIPSPEKRLMKNANVCPFCGSDDLDNDGHDNDGCGNAWLNVTCNNCDARLVEDYKLVSVDVECVGTPAAERTQVEATTPDAH